MDSNFIHFINNLTRKLREPLPGNAAHELMSPASRRKYPSNPDLSKAKLSSVLALFYPADKSIRLIFIQRPLYNGVHSGQIAFPGGRFEETDRNLMETALRETYEEIGISPEQIHVMGKLTNLYIPPSNFLVFPYLGYLSNEPVFVPDPQEVHEVFSLNVFDLLKKDMLQEREVSGLNYQLSVPCFYINNRLIWGATSMMLSELIEIIRGIK